MSIRFRQRIKVFPGIYLNIGKNGVSTTIGPRGANINIGKDGVYLNSSLPGTGLSYREKIGGKDLSETTTTHDNTSVNEVGSLMNPNSQNEITTCSGLIGLKEQLETSRKEREALSIEFREAESNLSKLKSKLNKTKNGFLSKFFASNDTINTLENEIVESSKLVDEIWIEYEGSKADINVIFDSETESQYESLRSSFASLLDSKVIWEITSSKLNTEIKSSAKHTVQNSTAKIQLITPDFIKSEHLAFNFQNADGSNLYIFPAFVLVIDNKGEIDLIDLSVLTFRFHLQGLLDSRENIPSDSKIIDYRWNKVNKDGSRDLRYADNYQIPVVQYGSFQFSAPNGLNRTYYISNAQIAADFANQFNRFLSLVKQGTPHHANGHEKNYSYQNDGSHASYGQEYHNLIVDFSKHADSLIEKLAHDDSIIEKIKDSLGDLSPSSFFSYCMLYDMCQVVKILGKGKIKKGGLEMTGLVLLSSRLLNTSEEDYLYKDYQTISFAHANGTFKGVSDRMIEVSNNKNPLNISLSTTQDNTIVSTKKIQGELSLPAVLKITGSQLFEEYATQLYRFATIISKADNVVTKKEEEILKGIYQIIYHPLPQDKNESLNISEANKNESLEQVLKELDELVGLDGVKNEVKTLMNYLKVQKEREKVGLKTSPVSYHCVFTGSPGTGKTTIARIVAKIYLHLGILSKGHLVETDRSGLVAEYTGQTAVKVNKTVNSALDGVLFIDEAYSLVGESKDDFGKEAVATLLKRMEDDRERLVVILAGYTDEIDTFLETNPGLKSRFNRYIEFNDYSPDELESIFKLKCTKLEYLLTDEAKVKLHNLLTDSFNSRDKSFGNARFVRNIFEKTLERQANRIAGMSSLTKEVLTTINHEDIPN